ncbi:MAG TPA: sigma-70 family RNA polymerase sigma factor [Gaiellaceae bacterium]|nr:sigma-70 family RNA polymerase sigma factor [Gaiellaceae bacterium]
MSDDADDRVERLYEDYSGRVYRYCLNRLGSPEEAEDALQATYLNVWRSLRSGVRPVSTTPWIFRIASNVCSTVLRTRLKGTPVVLQTPEALDQIPAVSEQRDELLGLSAALERLPERQRHALLLRDWRGLSYDEIAAELDSSYEAVETLLFRARKAVAAGLTMPESVPVPVRARALAPLPLLVPLHNGFAAVKSAITSTIAPIKVSIGIALGASAPLIAYGLLEEGVFSHPPPAKTAAAAPQNPAPARMTLPLVTRTVGDERTGVTTAPSSAEKHAAPSHSGGSAPASGGGVAGETYHGSSGNPGPGGTTTPPQTGGNDPGSHPPSDPGGNPPPDPGTDPPPGPTSPPPPPPAGDGGGTPAKVTICHQTGSKKHPGVTITVAAPAVEAHLAHGDYLGACVT